jgi:hypothetical protein
VRDIAVDPTRFQGFYAGHGFPRLEVRDFVAMQMAYILELPVQLPHGKDDKQMAYIFESPVQPAHGKDDRESTEHWSAERWSRLREQVMEAYRNSTGSKSDKK